MNDPKVIQLDFGFDRKAVTDQKPRSKSNNKIRSDFVFDFMDCLTGPIIVFRSAWQDAVPKDVLNNISLARMMCLMAGEQTASLTEVVAYMMPRTFESPMHHEWVNIYTWAGVQYANFFKGSEQRKTMAEIAPDKLSDQERRLLNDLRRWIYDKRRKALKQSLKSEKPAKSKDVVTQQESLFDK